MTFMTGVTILTVEIPRKILPSVRKPVIVYLSPILFVRLISHFVKLTILLPVSTKYYAQIKQITHTFLIFLDVKSDTNNRIFSSTKPDIKGP